jgi:hypothetical protein
MSSLTVDLSAAVTPMSVNALKSWAGKLSMTAGMHWGDITTDEQTNLP